jgi:hypothetical protein
MCSTPQVAQIQTSSADSELTGAAITRAAG